MRILVLSKEAWRDEQSGGNVLSNIFSGFDAEFAQIYCTESEPSNHVCKLYYQMTDRMMVGNVLKRKKIGLVKEYEDYPQYSAPAPVSYTKAKAFGFYARMLRELLWKVAGWNNDGLRKFVQDFNPDIIFAPCYSPHYMLRLTEIVHKYCPVKIISYISDDFYTFNQSSYSPLFWLNHLATRHHVRKVFKLYSLIYTMTDEQKEQCERDLKANMKILRKGGDFLPDKEKKQVNKPIRFIYAGGLYLNRDVTLSLLAKAMQDINADEVKMRLDIYSGNPLNASLAGLLNDGRTSTVHKSVNSTELKRLYGESDVALHVEGFDKKNMKTVRLSFSTKIVDCLDSGCAVMAICDDKQAGLAYLNRNDAAICITDTAKIAENLELILKDPSILIEYQKKAFELGRKNHNRDAINQMLLDDFTSYTNS